MIVNEKVRFSYPSVSGGVISQTSKGRFPEICLLWPLRLPEACSAAPPPVAKAAQSTAGGLVNCDCQQISSA